MKTIVAIVGSNHKDSRTNRLINIWLKRMSELDDTINYEVFCLRDYKIEMCTGCATCFYKGFCVLDKKDDLFFLKEKMRDSDIVIFSSPVYCNNLSGIMKNFVDRLAVYYHTLDLSGKLGFTLTTTSFSGGDTVSNMLKDLQFYMGIKNLNNYSFVSELDDEIESVNRWATASVQTLAYQWNFTDQKLEAHFSSLKEHYTARKTVSPSFTSEIDFWQQPAVQQCLSFQEFALKYKQFYKPIYRERFERKESFHV